MLLSLLTFDINDPSLNHVVSGNVVIGNKAGLFGAYLAGFLNDVLGIAAFIWPLIFGALGAAYVSSLYEPMWRRWCGYFLLTLCLLNVGAALDLSLGDVRGGGMAGRALHESSRLYFSPGGSALIWLFAALIALQLAFDVSWTSLTRRLFEYCKKRFHFRAVSLASIPKPALPKLPLPKLPLLKRLRGKLTDRPAAIEALPKIVPQSLPSDAPEPELLRSQAPSHGGVIAAALPVGGGPGPAPASGKKSSGNGASPPLPPLELLAVGAPPSRGNRENMEGKGRALMACLTDFGIQGELVRITPGPVVTMFEVRPAAGIRVSRIANLSDDLALALKAIAVRIQAPIPGTDTVGIEIPNADRQTVNFRVLLESETFRKSGGPLTMALGKDIAGRPFAADLSRMPHLLVAGATGAGKSVCLNSILLSLLYTVRPRDVQLLLVDPKRIEMAAYADLPHLVHPVVTEMAQAKTALDWAVHEMDRRYETMGRFVGVRNLAEYNRKLAAFGKNLPPDFADLEPLPYLVVIIDELADLMLTAAREVETSIVRLAQLARAAGIHMILATQRPSVDVVTGLIKANFPCRISFQVTSKHDSRTILDTVGAEHLLGKGDMLFKPGGGRLQRLHGPFVSDEEVQAVVDYWKRQMPPAYKVDFSDWGVESGGGAAGGDAADDPLYGEVRAFVADQGKASISFIQRRFKIGFNRAARLVEQLEHDGVVGPPEGGKTRSVVR